MWIKITLTECKLKQVSEQSFNILNKNQIRSEFNILMFSVDLKLQIVTIKTD